MDSNMKQFFIEVSQNEELKAELLDKLGDQANDAREAVLKIIYSMADFAKEKGYDIDVPTIMTNTVQVDDEALDSVVGGRLFLDTDGNIHGDCKCVMGGGGQPDEHQKTCACVVSGTGLRTEEGEEWVAKHGDPYYLPLFCILGGGVAPHFA